MLATFTQWLVSLVVAILTAILQMLGDAFTAVFGLLFDAISAAVSAIPVPTFLTQYSLTSLLNQLSPDVIFFASQLRLGQAFTILAAGFSFRMLRKVFTLGQW